MEKRGKWRRGEEQLTKAQRVKIAELMRDGYDVGAVMERFGLTDEEQAMVTYRDPSVTASSPLDSVSVGIGFFRTSWGDLYREVKAAHGGKSWSMLDRSEYF